MLGRACSAVASYLGFETCTGTVVGLCRVNVFIFGALYPSKSGLTHKHTVTTETASVTLSFKSKILAALLPKISTFEKGPPSPVVPLARRRGPPWYSGLHSPYQIPFDSAGNPSPK